jgi:hypothetical protein
MGKKRHQRDTKTFNELSFQEQAKSLNAQFATLRRAVRAHVRNAKQPDKTLAKCVAQIGRLMTSLDG